MNKEGLVCYCTPRVIGFEREKDRKTSRQTAGKSKKRGQK